MSNSPNETGSESLMNETPKSLQLYRIKQHILYQELDRLVLQSTRGSYYTTENRTKIYKLLLNYTSSSSSIGNNLALNNTYSAGTTTTRNKQPTTCIHGTNDSQPNLTEECANQIQLDVNRTFGKESVCNSDRLIIRENLTNLLCHFFKKYGDWLSYYQGFHEVAAILLGFGMFHAKQILPGIAFIHLRDFMEPDMKSTLQHCSFIMNLLSLQDLPLYTHLTRNIPDFNAFFSIPWLLTLFSHGGPGLEREDILIIFDALLSHHPALSHCLATQLLIFKRDELLQCSDMSEVLQIVLKLPGRETPLQKLIHLATLQLESHKSSAMAKRFYSEMGPCSVINTFIDVSDRNPDDLIPVSQFKSWSLVNRVSSSSSSSATTSQSILLSRLDASSQWNIYALGLLGLTLMFILSSSSGVS